MAASNLQGIAEPQRRYRAVDSNEKAIRLWMKVGLFADELARLLPAESLRELLQTKDADERSVLQT